MRLFILACHVYQYKRSSTGLGDVHVDHACYVVLYALQQNLLSFPPETSTAASAKSFMKRIPHRSMFVPVFERCISCKGMEVKRKGFCCKTVPTEKILLQNCTNSKGICMDAHNESCRYRSFLNLSLARTVSDKQKTL